MLAVIAKHNVTTLVTTGLDDVFTELRFGQSNVSYLTDAVLALRYAEAGGCLRKFMAVVKVRGCAHSHDFREYQITDEGLEVDEQPTDLDGILTGRPQPRQPGR